MGTPWGSVCGLSSELRLVSGYNCWKIGAWNEASGNGIPIFGWAIELLFHFCKGLSGDDEAYGVIKRWGVVGVFFMIFGLMSLLFKRILPASCLPFTAQCRKSTNRAPTAAVILTLGSLNWLIKSHLPS